MKEQTMTSIDPDLKKKAKEKGWNLSDELERALINKMHKPDIEEIKELKCAFCQQLGEKETTEDVKIQNEESQRNNNAEHPSTYAEPTKLTWLWPDEQWICNRCLKIKCNSVNIA